jgi:asparagine synthase (glutamine-hydrolysing)
MCGVFGVLGSGIESPERRKIALGAIAALGHRGPDAWGVYSTTNMLLGHVRLSVVDVAGGHQPMVDDKAVVSFNGEIYNHTELRAELKLKGFTFKTTSDTEVILKMYESEGVECFQRFNGQFSVLLWDKEKKSLVVARDRFGIRPLYVLDHRGCLFFSSEMKAFDTIDTFQREFSPEHLFEHALLWNTLGDSSIYRSIRNVESGTYEVYSNDQTHSITRYYQIGETFSSFAECQNFDSTKAKFKSLLSDAVSLRLRSDVPVGAYLSGGIDSTVIAQIVKQQTNHPFKTFSVSFKDPSLDESTYQLLASERIASEHESIQVSQHDIDKEMLNTIYHTERPVFRTAPVPLHMLSGLVKKTSVKVVLTGEGADEILCGYDAFKELKILDHWKSHGADVDVVKYIGELYPHLAHYADPKRFGLMKMYYEGFVADVDNDLAGLNIRINNNKIIEKFLNKNFNVKFDKSKIISRLKATLPEAFQGWSLMQKNSYLEIKTLLQGYLLSSQGDRMTLSHGIEGRFPFLDHRVVEYAFGMPDEYKLKGFDQKFILKEAFKEEIPAEIIDRPKRPYMAPDLISFVRPDGSLTEIAADMLSEKTIEEYGLFDVKTVARFLKKFGRGIPENIGYRDNMIFIFLLSTQMSMYWIKNPFKGLPDPDKCTVDITE